ncbi:MAG: NADH-quinone oxidoreductase subunit C [Bacteroidota bacterium]
MTPSEIIQLVSASFKEAIISDNLEGSIACLGIDEKLFYEVAKLLHEDERTYFDSLSCLTGIDNGPDEGTMEVIYNLYSIPHDLHLMLQVKIGRENPELDSISDIWKAAEWHEREAYDMTGIRFKNHPDLRRILMPEDWEGYPLRKDYQEQEIYHDIKVKY